MLGEDASEPALVRERQTDEEKEDVVLVSAATASLLRAWLPRLSERRQSRHPRSRAAEKGDALEDVSRTMRADAAVVLAAVRQSALALQQACEASRERKSSVLAATRQNGHALLYAREALRGETERRCPRNGHALAHAREALRGGAEVVLAAAVLAVRTEKAVAFAAAVAERLRGALLRSRSSFKGMKSSSPPSVNRATRPPSRAKQ